MYSVFSLDSLDPSLLEHDALYRENTRLRSVSKTDPNNCYKISTQARRSGVPEMVIWSSHEVANPGESPK